jgi:hypothetical protein
LDQLIDEEISFFNKNLNDGIDNVIDDIYFEPEVSKPYTRRSEKQYDEYINYNENDNRLLHPPINNVENDRYSLAPRLTSTHNNINNNLLKPPKLNFKVNNKFIKPAINTQYSRLFHPPISAHSLTPRLPSIHNNLNNNNEAINESINENIHINNNIGFTIHEVEDNEDETPNVLPQPHHETVTIPSTIQEPDDPQL